MSLHYLVKYECQKNGGSFGLLTNRLMPSVTDRLLIMYGILLQHLFSLLGGCVQSIMGFYMAGVKIILSVNKIINTLRDKYFKTVFFQWLSLT